MVYDTCLRPNGILNDYFNMNEIIKIIDNDDNLEDERWAKRLWIIFMLSLWGEDQ